MATIVPLNAVSYQSIKTTLSGVSVQINLQQRGTGLYATIWLSGTMKCAGVLCQDRTWLVRYPYLGFSGDLAFVDTQGTSDPTYDGLGARYQLVYVEGQNV
ncbi:phage baseplate plug protein [Acetobacter sp.]|uniref:phage baseplate plug family protein n=1 Tax=Acetobacter sp. TaxID=440 RepID=UPI0039E76132